MPRPLLVVALALAACRGDMPASAPGSTPALEPSGPAIVELAAAEPAAAEPAAAEPAAAEPAAAEPAAAEPAPLEDPEEDLEDRPEVEPPPAWIAIASALSRTIHAPTEVLGAVDTAEGTFVTFRYNTLASHLGRLDPEARAQTEARLKAMTEACEARRVGDEPGRRDRATPCDVSAAETLIPRERPTPGKIHYPISAFSSRCDALGIALVDPQRRVLAHRVLTDERCYDEVAPLELRDFTGSGRPQVVVLSTHEVWRTMAWGFTVETREREIQVFDADRTLTEVFDLTLDRTIYLETKLRSTCRYTLDAPGVVTSYCEAWNSLEEGLEVARVRWDKKRRRWGEPKPVKGAPTDIPDAALPLDRPSE
ncbi:MAG: hypothetical protein R3B09_13410 [Nannocystaceae bacterium]